MDPSSTQAYIELLEKTNQQLSLWYNPYGLMVGVLTALVALMAITFAYILLRQGKEYRDAFKSFLDEQRQIADSEIAKALLNAKKVVDSSIKDATKRLKEVKDLKSQAKKDLEKEIEELKKQRESIERTSSRITLGNPTIHSTIGTASTSTADIMNGAGALNTLSGSTIEAVAGTYLNTFCPSCGWTNYNDSHYCRMCGTKLK